MQVDASWLLLLGNLVEGARMAIYAAINFGIYHELPLANGLFGVARGAYSREVASDVEAITSHHVIARPFILPLASTTASGLPTRGRRRTSL